MCYNVYVIKREIAKNKKKREVKKMKKLVKGLMVLSILGLVVANNYSYHHYTRRNCEVVKVSQDCATFKDSCGNLWVAECEGLEIGDTVDLKMFMVDDKYWRDSEIIDIIKK